MIFQSRTDAQDLQATTKPNGFNKEIQVQHKRYPQRCKVRNPQQLPNTSSNRWNKSTQT